MMSCAEQIYKRC